MEAKPGVASLSEEQYNLCVMDRLLFGRHHKASWVQIIIIIHLLRRVTVLRIDTVGLLMSVIKPYKYHSKAESLNKILTRKVVSFLVHGNEVTEDVSLLISSVQLLDQ